MHVYEFDDDFRHVYPEIIDWVREEGDEVAPRGIVTTEILDALIIMRDPTKPTLLTGMNRGYNTRIAAFEALQLIGGFSDPATMVRIAPATRQFLYHGSFRGAYGPRLQPQLIAAVNRLRADPSTRQAVVTVWDPAQDLYVEGLLDYPCTVMLQFLIRKNRLIMHTTMRSNDVWWGLAYDMFQFTQLQLTVARCLKLEPGPYHHHAVSLHVYERDLEKIGQMSLSDSVVANPLGIRYRLGDLGDRNWSDYAQRARDMVAGKYVSYQPEDKWYSEQIERMYA